MRFKPRPSALRVASESRERLGYGRRRAADDRRKQRSSDGRGRGGDRQSDARKAADPLAWPWRTHSRAVASIHVATAISSARKPSRRASWWVWPSWWVRASRWVRPTWSAAVGFRGPAACERRECRRSNESASRRRVLGGDFFVGRLRGRDCIRAHRSRPRDRLPQAWSCRATFRACHASVHRAELDRYRHRSAQHARAPCAHRPPRPSVTRGPHARRSGPPLRRCSAPRRPSARTLEAHRRRLLTAGHALVAGRCASSSRPRLLRIVPGWSICLRRGCGALVATSMPLR